ncbi:MAG: hypothetical protein ACD_45C00744G0010 [uncultured bacterium]|nr:MAG: hypothetical protein ACD_45C00744G0010 [uncultured bacterium]
MYYINGIEEVTRSIQKVLGLSGITGDLSDKKLQECYYRFLKKESIFSNFHFSDDIQLTDFHGLKKIAPEFCVEKEKHFSSNSFLLQKRTLNGFFKNAFSNLEAKNPVIFGLARFLIKLILVNQLTSYTNGTTNDTIGFSSMDFKDHFNEQDFIELVIHQMTHMVLFMDDRCYEHMRKDNKEAMIETGLKYVLGGTKFPAYLAFHSYIVGVEVLCFRWQSTGLNYQGIYHGDTSRIINVCEAFKKSLLDHVELFFPRGQSILNDSIPLLNKVIAEYSN